MPFNLRLVSEEHFNRSGLAASRTGRTFANPLSSLLHQTEESSGLPPKLGFFSGNSLNEGVLRTHQYLQLLRSKVAQEKMISEIGWARFPESSRIHG